MNSIRQGWFLILTALLAVAIIAAGRTGTTDTAPESTGASPTAERVTIREILESPGDFDGKEVTVSGKIATECGSGCWFILEENGAQMYVDIAPENFAIPQLQGSTATITGTVSVLGGTPTIVGKSVTAGGKVFP